MTVEYTFEAGTWAGAEVWAWTDGEGELIGRASFANAISDAPRVTVRLDNGRVAHNFRTADEALTWITASA